MGFVNASPDDRVEYLIVASARGKLRIGSVQHAKARLFVLEDRTAVVVLPDPGGGLVWSTYAVDTSSYDPPSETLTVRLADGGELALDARGCGCGMGAVGNAGPVDGPYRLTAVRAPEWHTVG